MVFYTQKPNVFGFVLKGKVCNLKDTLFSMFVYLWRRGEKIGEKQSQMDGEER